MRVARLWAVASLSVLSLTVACGGGSETPPATSAEPTAVAGPKVDEGTAGNINGKIVYEGAAPKNELIKMNSDQVCMREAKGSAQMQETILVGEGNTLQNV